MTRRALGNVAAIFFVVLLAVYSTTLTHPYLFMDEGWLVRSGTWTWTLSMGRPLFAATGWIAAKTTALNLYLGIFALRISGVIGLAVAGTILMGWFELWGYGRVTAFALALSAMTLPAYQIIVAGGPQLASAVAIAMFGAYFCYAMRGSWQGYAVAALALLFALAIYQTEILIGFAMLSIPLLRGRGDRDTRRFVVVYSILTVLVSGFYFLVWKFLYRIFWPGRIDTRYGPDALRLPSLDQAEEFWQVRIPQVANLWNVEQPHFGLAVAAVAALIFIKIARDFRLAPKTAAINYILILGLAIASDGLRIIAGAYPSYTTAAALSLIIFYWAFCGAEIVLQKFVRSGAVVIAIVGCVLAYVTVRNDFALPNGRDVEAIRKTVLAHPDAKDFHILGRLSGGNHYQEFGMRVSAVDVYLNLTARDVIDDLIRSKKLRVPWQELYVSIGHVGAWAAPDSTPSQPKPDSVVVDLEALNP